MDIVVCVKRTPETAEADLIITPDGRSVEPKGLVFDINEWDNYAVEEAVRLKESHGGTVTVVSVGGQECEDVLRRGLAMGADAAIRVDLPEASQADGWSVATTLAAAIRDLPKDLILCGVQASDDGMGQVGPALAVLLGLTHATLVAGLDIDGERAVARRELEAGWEEEVSIKLPALLTIQSGINVPRYVSVLGIRKVRKKPIDPKSPADLGLGPDRVGRAGSLLVVEALSAPETGEGAEMLEGSLDAVADRLVELLRDKAGVV